MKKEIKTQYGIQIVKPWSKEMYDHNEMVAAAVRVLVTQQWENAMNTFEERFEPVDEEGCEISLFELDWCDEATPELKRIQRAVTISGFGFGYDMERVSQIVMDDLEDAPLYRLNEIAEELELDLKVGFVGFN